MEGWFWDGTDDIDIDTGVRGARYSYYPGVLFFLDIGIGGVAFILHSLYIVTVIFSGQYPLFPPSTLFSYLQR